MPVKLTIAPPNDSNARVVEFNDTLVHVGRSSRCDIRLPFRIVSGHHLTIASDDGIHYRVRDEASTNGTVLDGQPMAAGHDYELSTGSRLDIIDLRIKVEMVPLLGEGISLEKTGTIVRLMLGEALLDGASDDVESAYFEVLSGPGKGEHIAVPDDLESARVAGDSDADLRVASFGGEFQIFRRGDGFGVRAISQEPAGEVLANAVTSGAVRVGDQPLSEARTLASGDEIQAGGVRLRFVDPLESFLRELDGIAPTSAPGSDAEAADDSPAPALIDPSSPPVADATGQAVQHQTDEPDTDSEQSKPNVRAWGLVEVGVVAITVLVLGGVIYLLLSIFGVV